MKRTLLFVMVTLLGVGVFLFGGTGFAKDQKQHGPKGGKHARSTEQGEERGGPQGKGRENAGGLPPGLAKRGGNLPPGLQKYESKHGGHLPPGLEKRAGGGAAREEGAAAPQPKTTQPQRQPSGTRVTPSNSGTVARTTQPKRTTSAPARTQATSGPTKSSTQKPTSRELLERMRRKHSPTNQ